MVLFTIDIIGMLSDREQPGVGAALFTREFGRLASHFANSSFLPNFIRDPINFLPPNRSHDIERANELCGESYQCRYDYGMSLDREMAHFTKNYYDSAVNIRETNMRLVMTIIYELELEFNIMLSTTDVFYLVEY